MADTNPKTDLPPAKSGGELLEMYFLDMRAHLLETAAAMDRIDRASGGAEAMKDERIAKLREACKIGADDKPERAQRFLELLSVEG